MQRIPKVITAILGSRTFLAVVFCFFVFESLWIAFSAAYPMAFDEDFHFGLIKIYSHHWLPFLTGQPADADQFGPVARDPSFLYHWLMSIPYRLVAAVTDNQVVHIIYLRCINIGIMAIGLGLFVTVLRRIGMSRAFVGTALALFVLIPIVPLVAGQVNYDSLFMLAVACLCLITFSLVEQLRAHTLKVETICLFVVLCMLGCLTKYAFVPIAATATIILLVIAWHAFGGNLRRLGRALTVSFGALGRRAKVGVIVFFVVVSGLFLQRYGLNLMRYHTPVPDCAVVLDEDSCQAYGPWARNFKFASEKIGVDGNPLFYTGIWLQGLHYRSFFMVNGPHHDYVSYPMVPLPSATAIAIVISCLVAVCLNIRRVFRGSAFSMYVLVMALAYIAVLWLTNYKDYLQTGQPVAVNGRYLLPVLLLVAAPLGRAFAFAISHWPSLKPLLATAAIVLFLQGGGVFSFIMRTDETWYWPHQTVVTHINSAARRIIDPLTFEGSKYY